MVNRPPALDLAWLEGPALARRRWRLCDGFALGRAEAGQVVLPEPGVSRRHALIERELDGWTVQDCGSRLGTRLNELPLAAGRRVALHVGDVLAIGPWRFRVDPAPPRADAAVRTARIDVVHRPGGLAEQRIELLLRCAGEAAGADDEQALANVLAEYALAGSGHARAAVLWRGVNGLELRSLRPVAAAGAGAFRFRRSLVASAEAGELAQCDADAEPGARSGHALCAPLRLDGRTEAFLYLDAGRAARRGHADAPAFCLALARLGALALANLRRLAGERAHARLTAELERAREVQRRLLPGAPVGALRHALHLEPGHTVAGDIADVFELPHGAVAALLGDVSGAGLGAGLVMASVQSFLRAELAHQGEPARALERLNRHLCAQASRGRFVTLWLGVFDPATRCCRFVDAGHGHALRLRSGEAAPIAARGDIPLGIDADAHFGTETLTLADDELVLLYSDGVTEQRAPDGNAFGRDRLFAALRGQRTPADAVAAVQAAWRAHAAGAPPDDDTTLLALDWSKRPSGR